jgi:branched-chain amino acid transport system substrate-binding protein
MFHHKALAVIFALLLVVSLGVGPTGTAAAPDVYKFGAVLILSGGSAIVGEHMQKGVECAVSDINGAGGIQGVPIKVIYEDGRARAQESVDAINKLISVDKIAATIMVSSPGVLATAPIATREHILMMNPGGQSPALIGASPYLFSNIVNLQEEIKVMLEYLRSKGHSRLALYGQNDDFGRGTDAYVKPLWQKMGGTYVGAEYHDLDTIDHSAVITKLRAWKPDSIYLPSGGRAMATFVKQLGEQGLKAQIASYGVMQTGDTVAIAGKFAEGAVITAQKQDYDAANNPRAKRFLDTFRQKYGAGTPNYYSGLTYDATYIWKEAVEWTLKQGRPYNGDTLREAILAIRQFDGTSGKVIFRDDGTSSRPINILQIKDGKFGVIATVDAKSGN